MGHTVVVIEAIEKEEFDTITNDTDCYISPLYGTISLTNAYVGKIDFDNPEFINYIKSLKIFPDEGYRIYSNFNYNTAEIRTIEGIMKYYETWDNVKICKYKHCQIGKPEYGIIFTKTINKYKSKKK